MLPPFIIEQIREREEEVRNEEQPQPTVELPIPTRPRVENRAEEEERGIVVIDLMG